jgi:hypothetical protein
MEFDLGSAFAILGRTPRVVRALLEGLPDKWTRSNEGGESWSPFDVVGHLIHGEKTDWIPRAKRILERGESEPFEPFDRFAQFELSKGKELGELLDEFESRRADNLRTLRELRLGAGDLERRGLHPDLGPVTLGQLLATWVAHDLSHVRQIARVMARQYRDEVGPWTAYFPVLAARGSR